MILVRLNSGGWFDIAEYPFLSVEIPIYWWH